MLIFLSSVVLLHIFRLSLQGTITPYGSKPIELSVNNQNKYSSYTFAFLLDSDLDNGDYIIVNFPNQFIFTAGSCQNLGYASYILPEDGNLVLNKEKPLLDCNYFANLGFKIAIPELKAGAFTIHRIRIEGILNPTTGGTGNFILETRKGDINVIDYNHAFGQVGIAGSPSTIVSTTVSRTKDRVNEVSAYTFIFSIINILPKGGFLTLELSSDSPLKIGTDFNCAGNIFTTPSCTRASEKKLIFKGIDTDLAVGSYSISVTSVIHPNYVASIGTVTIQTWKNGTNTIIDERVSQALPVLLPGIILSTSSKMWTTNFNKLFSNANSYQRSKTDTIRYEFNFYATNSVGDDGKITLNFPFTVSSAEPCYNSLGLEDISEDKTVFCAISGSQISLTNFKGFPANRLITINFLATNPSSSGTYSSLTVTTYLDAVGSKKVDEYSGTHNIVIDNYPSTTKFLISSSSFVYKMTGTAWTITFRHFNNFVSGTNVGKIEMYFASVFSFGSITCTLTPNGGAADVTTCSLVGNKFTITSGTLTNSYTNSADHTLVINGINNPSKGGSFPVEVFISRNNIVESHQTLFVSITPDDLVSPSVESVTRDFDRFSVYIFKFKAPEYIPQGNFPFSFVTPTSKIVIEFSTQGAGGCNHFRTDLGTGKTPLNNLIDCYGIQNIMASEAGKNIKCALTIPNSVGVSYSVLVTITGYNGIPADSDVEIHIPKIKNSQCRTEGGKIRFWIERTDTRVASIIYRTNVYLVLPNSILNLITKNSKNEAGLGGTSMNPSPKFSPTTVNYLSSLKIQYTPSGTDRYLTLGTSSLILQFPPLPDNNPKSNLLPAEGLNCYLGLVILQNCYSYPEIGWVLIYLLTNNLPLDPTVTPEVTIYLTGIKNPPFAADMKSFLNIITIDDYQGSDTVSGVREMEEIKFQNFDAFTTDTVKQVNVFGKRYEANLPDVEYQWIFILTNDVPYGGKILLKFAPNAYNLESTPLPKATITTGMLEIIDNTQPMFTYKTNVATISNFQYYTAGTLIAVKITGVRNPPTEQSTTDFEIESQTSYSYSIDRKNDIPGMVIMQAQTLGQVVFNYFYTTPNNGLILADYYISVSFTYSIPIDGIIEVVFPLNFITSSFEKDASNNVRCSVFGPITTVKSCIFSGTTTIRITLREKLIVRAGTPPLIIKFPRIYNFNSELSSSVLIVRTIYDSVILDDSGNEETNRKATTGISASVLTVELAGFKYEPKTEGALANYTLGFKPKKDIPALGTIQIQFPFEFPRGLGPNVACYSKELEINSDTPLYCSVEGWKLNVSNFKFYNASQNPFGLSLLLVGIRNPRVSATPLATSLLIYILISPWQVSEYAYNVGSLTYLPAPSVLFMKYYNSKNTNTRAYSDYVFGLESSITKSLTQIIIDFPVQFDIQNFWKRKQVVNYISGNSLTRVNPVKNTITIGYVGSFSSGQYFAIDILELLNPLDQGVINYPIIAAYDEVSKQIVLKTYDNLNQYLTPNYAHNGAVIVLNNDLKSLKIEAGTYSADITAYFPDIKDFSRMITPLISVTNGIIVTDIVCPPQQTQVIFQIGIAPDFNLTEIFVEWSINATNYIPVRPVQIKIVKNYDVGIDIDDILEVPSGGRSSPKYIKLANAPYNDLTIDLFIKGYYPTYSSVYPKSIEFLNGSRTSVFWVSVGANSRGTKGQILFTMRGTNKAQYSAASRTKSFTVSVPDKSPPLIYYMSDIKTNGGEITFDGRLNEPCTVYFAIFTDGSPKISFAEVKAKALKTDYFSGIYWIGEHINDLKSNSYSLKVSNLAPFQNYTMVFYIEDLGGNLYTRDLIYTFSTNGSYTNVLEVYISLYGVTKLTKSNYEVLSKALASEMNIEPYRVITDPDLLPETKLIPNVSASQKISRTLQADQTNGSSTQNDSSASSSINSTDNNSVASSNNTLLDAEGVPKGSAGNYILKFIIVPENKYFGEISSWTALQNLYNNLYKLPNSVAKANLSYGNKGIFFLEKTRTPVKWHEKIKPKIGKIYTNSVVIDNIALARRGRVYSIILRTNQPLFLNTQTPLSESIRYLQQVDSSNSSNTNSSNASTPSNSTDSTNSSNATNSTNSSSSNSDFFIKSDVFTKIARTYINKDSQIKNPSCSQLDMNYLSIFCNGSGVTNTDYSRNDYYLFRAFRIPTPLQISRGLDADNHRSGGYAYVDIKTVIKGYRIVYGDLERGENYTVFLVGADSVEGNHGFMSQSDIVVFNITTPFKDIEESFSLKIKFEILLIIFYIFALVFFVFESA